MGAGAAFNQFLHDDFPKVENVIKLLGKASKSVYAGGSMIHMFISLNLKLLNLVNRIFSSSLRFHSCSPFRSSRVLGSP